MSFLKRFFSCGCQEPSENPLPLLPKLCFPKKGKGPRLSRGSLPKTSQDNAKQAFDPPYSFSPPISNRKRVPPLTLRLKFNHFRTGKVNGMDWGFVVGMVNCQQLISRLIKKPYMGVRIGKNQQISRLAFLRPRSLDCLVIYWSQLGCEYSLTQILKTQQRLLFIFQTWQSLTQVLIKIDSQISIFLKTVKVKQVMDRLSFSITHIESFFVLQFEQLEGVAQNLMKTVQNVVGFKIEGENKNRILQKVTVPIYFDIIEHSQYKDQVIRELYEQITEETKSIEVEKRSKENKEGLTTTPQSKGKESKNDKRNAHSLRDKTKKDEIQLQVAYFRRKNQEKRPPPITVKDINADLQIFNYNFHQQQEETTNQAEQQRKQSNLVSPRFMSKKATSKSVDPEYQSYDFFDDQIFEKYD